MTDTFEWQGKVGDSWAAQWSRTDRSFGPLDEMLVARALNSQEQIDRIVDIGCGAGATSLSLARAIPGAVIRGIDISSSLIRRAKERAGHVPQCSFKIADASQWRDPDFTPNLLVSRHGVMFFDDPVAAFANLLAGAAASARIIFSCFRSRTENDWASKITSLLPVPPPDPGTTPGPFAFADMARVSSILAGAGWIDATADAVDFNYTAGGGDDPVNDALDFFSHIGPAAPVIRSLTGAPRSDFLKRLTEVVSAHLAGGTVSFGAAAWIWTAQKE